MRAFLTLLALPALAIGNAVPAAVQTEGSGQSSFSLDQLDSAIEQVESLRDLSSWVGKKPDPAPEFGYAETRAFDMQLHQSLKATLPKVNVRVDGRFTRGAVPERMAQWLRAVDREGSVRTCVVDDGGKGFFALIALAISGFKHLDKWMLYRPARNYDAFIIVTPEQSKVMNVIFTEKGTVSACPKGTREHSEKAK
jgi:hypothetical protein